MDPLLCAVAVFGLLCGMPAVYRRAQRAVCTGHARDSVAISTASSRRPRAPPTAAPVAADLRESARGLDTWRLVASSGRMPSMRSAVLSMLLVPAP